MSEAKKKILVVEEDKAILELILRELRGAGFEVASAPDDETAEKRLATELPDLILLDILLPRMGGIPFLERIKTDEKTKDIPVLVLSNFSADQTIARATELGASGYLIKSDQEIEDVVMAVKKELGII